MHDQLKSGKIRPLPCTPRSLEGLRGENLEERCPVEIWLYSDEERENRGDHGPCSERRNSKLMRADPDYAALRCSITLPSCGHVVCLQTPPRIPGLMLPSEGVYDLNNTDLPVPILEYKGTALLSTSGTSLSLECVLDGIDAGPSLDHQSHVSVKDRQARPRTTGFSANGGGGTLWVPVCFCLPMKHHRSPSPPVALSWRRQGSEIRGELDAFSDWRGYTTQPPLFLGALSFSHSW